MEYLHKESLTTINQKRKEEGPSVGGGMGIDIYVKRMGSTYILKVSAAHNSKPNICSMTAVRGVHVVIRT